MVNSSQGGGGKDTWVLGRAGRGKDWTGRGNWGVEGNAMLCRVADDLFWMSRYVERAVAVGRLIDVTLSLELDVGDSRTIRRSLGAAAWPASAAGDGGNILSQRCARRAPDPGRASLPGVRSRELQLADLLHPARARRRRAVCASPSRARCGSSSTRSRSHSPIRSAEAEEDPHAFFSACAKGCQFFQGLADCTLAQRRRLALHQPRQVLGARRQRRPRPYLQAHLLITPDPRVHVMLASGPGTADDPTVRWLAVLRSCGCAEAYARYYSLRVEPARVVEFLLLNPLFPQSVRFSLGAAWDALRRIHEARSSPATASPEVRALGLLRARLEHAAVDEILEEGLDAYLADVQQRIVTVSDHVTRIYMRDEPQPGRLVAVTRAAMIMAAQQQQQQQSSHQPVLSNIVQRDFCVRVQCRPRTRLDYSEAVVEEVMDTRLGPHLRCPPALGASRHAVDSLWLGPCLHRWLR